MKQLRITNKERFQDRVVLPVLSITITLLVWYKVMTPEYRDITMSIVASLLGRV